MEELKFSVVIPTHHRLDFLKRLIKALEEQNFSFSDFEVQIILSPGDRSLSWLENYQGPLRLFYEAPKADIYAGKNVSFKRNFGARKSNATWLAFTDDDCLPCHDWLKEADKHRNNPDIYGIEGKTEVPENSPRTLTWKGLKRLSRPGGYQTCNIFYRKSVFDQNIEFDSKNFPWFLEDTDMAWSVLEMGKKIVFDEKCIVEHPVGPRASWRLLHEAKGAGLKVKLFKRHPLIYREKNMKALRKPHYIYLFFILGVFITSLLGKYLIATTFLAGMLFIHIIHLVKIFFGLQFQWTEVFEVSWRTVLSAPIAFFSVLKASLRNKLSLREMFEILKP